MNLELNNKNAVIGAGIAILLLAVILFGAAGLKTLLAMFLFFLLPTYLIIDLFDFKTEEKIFFSFCIGLGLFPLIVWYVNRVVPSLRISLILAFTLIIGIALLFRLKKKKTKGFLFVPLLLLVNY
jgi:hypothetical protein